MFVGQIERVDASKEGLFIMASDGLWDVSSAEKVAEIAVASHRSSGGKASIVAETLVQHAQDCKTRDDVTVVVVVAHPAP
jgi:serine/threonine protein phosphatase PrpC